MLLGHLRSTATVSLAVAAVVLAWRRLAGAVDTPLGPGPLLASGLLLAGLAGFAHTRLPVQHARAVCSFVSIAIVVIALSLSISGTNRVALLAFWAVLVAEEVWAWRRTVPAASKSNATRPPKAMGERTLVTADEVDDETDPNEPAGDITQQLTRRTTTEGGQDLTGWLRMPLAAGQRTGTLHVAFCPPFNEPPTVEAEAISGPACRIKIGPVMAHGVRLDAKLDAAAEAGESVLVWFYAIFSANR